LPCPRAVRPPPTPPPVPYTTLFRSEPVHRETAECHDHHDEGDPRHLLRRPPDPRPPRRVRPRAHVGLDRGGASGAPTVGVPNARSEEHSLNSSHVSISYAVFCLKKK